MAEILIYIESRASIGRLTESGELYIVGRKKRMIVRYDGTKIFPIEIEVALLKCPCVRACAAVGATVPLHPQSGVPIVYVVTTHPPWYE